MKTHLVAAIGFTLCAALGVPPGCGSGAGPEATGEETATTAEGMSLAYANHYYTATPDYHWCSVAPCQGYLLKEANSDGAGTRAVLDFSSAHLDDATLLAVEEAPRAEIVFYGTFGPDPKPGATFHVREAFRGMPGIVARPGEALYVVKQRDPRIECLVAPCDNLVAERLGSEESYPFTTLSVDRAAAFRVDQAWLSDRVIHHGAVVTGHLRQGLDLAGGPERVLDAGQVFDGLPDRGGPCLLPFFVCREGTRIEYTRTVDRCLVFAGCAEDSACRPARPTPCHPGYTPVRWASAGPTCYTEVCDPSFLDE